ncbi:hypothetical protein L6164_022037 [Bauhinia variegata]|uniref:Uncharacterized protein n=1 Tax=Bauhinia variegata TaxID=167791 RepID=A0ACB9MDV8_BAUVA|nr:hypothetical protein L6164_022037 [Bauhinia variegata]
MNSRAISGFSNVPQGLQTFGVDEDLILASVEVNSGSGSQHCTSLLFNLSLLKDKVSQVQTLMGFLISPDQRPPESTSVAVASINSIIQDIIVTATSMMFTCQHLSLSSTPPGTTTNCTNQLHQQQYQSHDSVPQSNFAKNSRQVTPIGQDKGLFSSTETLDCYGEGFNNADCLKDDDPSTVGISETNNSKGELSLGDDDQRDEGFKGLSPKNYDIIELDAADLLAKYTHYCQICGKGFKRDANLRMHMRAHGDEYKTSAALSNPMKNKENLGEDKDCLMSPRPKKYSCPQLGCRWNRKHAKFQPLKSMICVKNHYKRSHCPKMYVCKICNQKQFSVLSDLRSHEKHCGDVKWQCSCGTTFSRKDKLMGHVALFVGHAPAINGLSFFRKLELQKL